MTLTLQWTFGSGTSTNQPFPVQLQQDLDAMVTAINTAQTIGQEAALTFLIDGGGSTITTGLKGYVSFPYKATINSVTLLGDQTGSIVVDIWKCTFAQFDAGSTHPVSGDSITASDKPTISSATKSTDSALTGWTTTINVADVLAFNVNSVTTLQRVSLALGLTKT
jgi:hypothetical protein